MPQARVADPSRRNVRSREAILVATRELILELGWDRLTIEGIANRAGVGKQTIYRWWPSRGAVVFEAFRAGDERRNIELPDTGDVEADLRCVLQETVREFRDPGFDGVMRSLFVEVQRDPELATELHDFLLGPLTEATVRRLESARGRGQIDQMADLVSATELLYGPVLRRWMLGTGELDDAFAGACASWVARALAPVT